MEQQRAEPEQRMQCSRNLNKKCRGSTLKICSCFSDSLSSGGASDGRVLAWVWLYSNRFTWSEEP